MNTGQLTLGSWLGHRTFQVEGSLLNSLCLSGDDIRPHNAPQATNKMRQQALNFRARYFPRFVKGLSILANYGHVVEGRNVGKSSTTAIGVTYQFFTVKKAQG
jgi:hypothetical protein